MCVTVPNARLAVALDVRERKASAHTSMTPALHKGQPVDDFLCVDSCVCGHAGETVEVSRYYSGGCLFFYCAPL